MRTHLHTARIVVRMKVIDIDTISWQGIPADRTKWRSALKQYITTGEDKLMTTAADKRARRKEGSNSTRPDTSHICVIFNKDCHSLIAHCSHKRGCYITARILTNILENPNIRMYHPWSSVTDGRLYVYNLLITIAIFNQ